MPLLGFLLTFIVVCAVVYCVRLLLPMLGLPEPFNQVILIVLALVALFFLIGALGIGPSAGIYTGYSWRVR